MTTEDKCIVRFSYATLYYFITYFEFDLKRHDGFPSNTLIRNV